ncbi:MAG: cytochrome C, partial [Phyllobacterium sp.]|nr:cytochrome C [Phyllobacterium sp.]
MIRKLLLLVIVAAMAGGAGFWLLSAPSRVDPARLAAAAPGDAKRGERVFWSGGCASCHAAPGARGDAR